ncbi:ABC transporter permease [Dongia rigui]|uniref:ABC transporter permease subunit n=1 Tax=Dongia rigui TaxID=940149 RepID=A0ABU5DVC9_9PROT|nr:ABC transporter permease subunit [Dongia rigui]MDY0871271.1 ABC transporter permease subunit [Dongia rigui]
MWASLAWGDAGYGDEFFKGIYTTLFISACAYTIAFGIGMLGAWSKLCHVKALNRAGEVYTTVVRSVPELLLIILIFYAGTSTLSSVLVGLGLAERGVEINPFGAVISALGIIYGAYLTDVLRGGIQAVPKGQIEAAKAFGMHAPQRFIRIILPQMVRYAISGLGNQWLNITKDSAFVSVVAAVGDIMSVGRGAANQTKHFLFYYGATAVVFMIVSGVSMYVTGRLEKRANRGVRRA